MHPLPDTAVSSSQDSLPTAPAVVREQHGGEQMRAIVLEKFGGLDSLVYTNIPKPLPRRGEVVIEVRGFGLNHAELHMRRGEWAEAAEVSGIECVGIVDSCPGGEFPIGAKVAALMGGLGRTINGSYAAVLDLVGNSTILDSLDMLRRGGSACLAGWLGGLDPIGDFNPLLRMASGVNWSFFGSFVFGTPGFPLSDVPLQHIAAQVAAGEIEAAPTRVFSFGEIHEAHRVMEAGEAGGKMVVVVK